MINIYRTIQKIPIVFLLVNGMMMMMMIVVKMDDDKLWTELWAHQEANIWRKGPRSYMLQLSGDYLCFFVNHIL